MKKIFLFICMLFMVGVVKAETLDIGLSNSNENNYVFDMLVKDIKDSKVNVISGTISYDENVFRNFIILYKVQFFFGRFLFSSCKMRVNGL